MKRYYAWVFLILVAALDSAALADVPPDPGFTRIQLSILIEAKDDFPDYRFFLVSGDIAKEVTIKKGERTTVSAVGGGARYSGGRVVAISATKLSKFGTAPAGDNLRELARAVENGEFADMITLIEHQFSSDIRTTGAQGWKDPLYRFQKSSDNRVEAVWVSGGAIESKTDKSAGVFYSADPKSPGFWTAVAGGSLLTLAFIFFGGWALRRTRGRSTEPS